MFKSIRTIVYPAPDMEKAKAFYSELLQQPPYFEEPYYIGFDVNGFELGLVPDGNPAGQSGPVTYWKIADMQATITRMKALGAQVFEKPHSVGDGIEVATMQDPFANLVGLITEVVQPEK